MEGNLCRFILYRFVYKCIFDRYPIIKRGGRLDPINRLNTASFLCLSQARHWISNIICRGVSCVQWVQLKLQVIVLYVVIGGIDYHHSLICLFIILLSSMSSHYIINVMCHRGLWHLFQALPVSINHEGISPVSIKTSSATVNSIQNW